MLLPLVFQGAEAITISEAMEKDGEARQTETTRGRAGWA